MNTMDQYKEDTSQENFSDFGKELLGIYKEKEKEPVVLEPKKSNGKYGLDVTVEYKGAFVYVQDENKENQNEENKKSRDYVHPSLMKKDFVGRTDSFRSTQSVSPSPKKVTFSLSHDTPRACRGHVVKHTTPEPFNQTNGPKIRGSSFQNFDSQFLMQDISDNFQVDEESMKCILNGEGFEEHFENIKGGEFKTPLPEKKSTNSNSALRRLSQTFRNKVDKTKRRSSILLDSTTKRLSLSTPKFMKKTRSKNGEVMISEAMISELSDLLQDVERDVLKSLLFQTNADVEKAAELYMAQKFS